MEIILAIVVAFAVIFFGALISMGNERQRKAIDGLREQVVLWAMQDLKIKREIMARDVQVDNPLGWLNRIATIVCGYDLKLQITESIDEPRTLICISGDRGRQVVFTTSSPQEIDHLRKEKRNRLAQYSTPLIPFLSLPNNTKTYEISSLNAGIMFDLELPLAWKGLTGKKIENTNRVWMYIQP